MSNDWLNKIPVKIVKITLITLLVLFAAIIVVGLATNKPIEVWFIKFNTRDRAAAIQKDTMIMVVHDTLTITKYIGSATSGSSTQQTKNIIKTDTTKPASKYNLQNPTFNGPTQVGDNNTQNIDLSVKQRHPTKADINRIVSDAPNKTTSIQIWIPPGDKECLIYGNEIWDILAGLGYSKISGTNWENATGFDKIDLFHPMKDSARLWILISPSSNVKN